jgi:hypothetical protein
VQAAFNLHKMISFASKLTSRWHWALLLSLLQLAQVNTAARQLLEQSSGSSTCAAVTELRSALAAVLVQAFTGSGAAYSSSAVNAYQHSVQVRVSVHSYTYTLQALVQQCYL